MKPNNSNGRQKKKFPDKETQPQSVKQYKNLIALDQGEENTDFFEEIYNGNKEEEKWPI